MAFLLGWNSKIILLRIPPTEHRRLLASMREYVRELNLSLKHPLNYYFDDPMADEGVRAQSFANEVFAQLKRTTDTEIANHFGAAHNLLLDLAEIDTLRNSRAKLWMIAAVLDIPPRLKLVPDTDPLAWAAALKDYFEALLARPPAQQLQMSGQLVM